MSQKYGLKETNKAKTKETHVFILKEKKNGVEKTQKSLELCRSQWVVEEKLKSRFESKLFPFRLIQTVERKPMKPMKHTN